MDYKFYGDGFQAHHIGPLGLYPTAGLQVIIQNSVNKLTVCKMLAISLYFPISNYHNSSIPY